jgi:sigma-B regulation protein RsbU (phosphoserine phosphatase)
LAPRVRFGNARKKLPQMTETQTARRFGPAAGPWQQRLEYVVDMMRDLSRQTDPQQLVRTYSRRMREILPADGFVSLSRRELEKPYYRITRSSIWDGSINPWKSPERLPVLRDGLLAELIYGEEPRVIDELNVSPDDPAFEHLRGHRSAAAIPLYDQGLSLNMVVIFRDKPNSFDREFLPEHTWLSNLFGRATHNLVLSSQVKEAYNELDRELQVVADIQRSLLPTKLPRIPTLELASHYQTSRRAGGDYYDFFPFDDGRWGFLIADVSGHGTPAAEIKPDKHKNAHTHHENPDPPSKLLNFVNRHLTARYTGGTGSFVTAFYGIYDPRNRTITYANAGHNPPRHKRAGRVVLGSLEGGLNLPLGIDPDEFYVDCAQKFEPGDAMIFYTDGITEARGAGGELFGTSRLDQILLSGDSAAEQIARRTIAAVEEFTGSAAPTDDRTMLVARVT